MKKQSDIKKLQDTICNMDGLSQECFSWITAIAKMARAAGRAENLHLRPEDFANAFDAILFIADTTENSMNCFAENVGCNFVNEVQP